MFLASNARACAERVWRMNFMIYWLHIGCVWVTHSLSSCQSHNFAFERIFVLAINDDTGVVRSDAVIWSVCLRNMCDCIQGWILCWHLCILMFSLRRDYFSSCCTKVLCAEYRLFEMFENSLVPNHYNLFWIINLVLDNPRFWEPMLSFVPPLAYEPCTPNYRANSCLPKETTSESILYSTGSMLNTIVWVSAAWQADQDCCHPT